MELRDIMTRNVEVVNGNASLKEAATKMKTLDVGLIPVCDGDRLKGLLTDRDITIRATANGRDPSKTKVNEVMSTDMRTASKTKQSTKRSFSWRPARFGDCLF
jgi:CBS domain-containing protein